MHAEGGDICDYMMDNWPNMVGQSISEYWALMTCWHFLLIFGWVLG